MNEKLRKKTTKKYNPGNLKKKIFLLNYRLMEIKMISFSDETFSLIYILIIL